MNSLARHLSVARCMLAVTAVAMFAASFSPRAVAGPAAETCLDVNSGFSFGLKLPRTAAILKAKKPLKIVTIGSSSTVGLWMSEPAKTYPGVMKSELLRLIPSAQFELVNSGRSGDTIPGNMARFERDVFAHNPDLVIWQMGGNDLTWGQSSESLESKIAEGVKAIRARGADVILMDQQYTPMILASSYAKMQAAITNEARQDKIALLPRFEMLHKTVEAGVSIGALSAFDGLHMSGEAYDCVGRVLARAIAAAVK